jgi:hypothetical protein
MKTSPDFEDSREVAVAMYYGLITEKFGEDYAKSLAFLSGEYEYEDLIKDYNNIINMKEENPTKPHEDWYRYQNKKKLVLNYFKYGKK